MRFIREIISGKQDANKSDEHDIARSVLDLEAFSLPDERLVDTDEHVSRAQAEPDPGPEVVPEEVIAAPDPNEDLAAEITPPPLVESDPAERISTALLHPLPDRTGTVASTAPNTKDFGAATVAPAATGPDRTLRRELPDVAADMDLSDLRPAERTPEPDMREESPDQFVQARPAQAAQDGAFSNPHRDDPFDRLDRFAEARPAPEAPSPFQRTAPDELGAEKSQRPRTRLADDLVMPAAAPVDMPAPAVGRAARRAGRVKTRLLGFGSTETAHNPFDAAANSGARGQQQAFPVGWLVIVSGPGRGQQFSLGPGVSQIGRGEDQAVRLDFGDNSISRSNHAAVAYDNTQQKFYLGHGGKANLVRLDGKPVLSTEELPSGGEIQIGETRLRFVALCGAGFDWDKNQDEDIDTAIFG